MAAVEPTEKIREAKVFLASRIADEAERKGVPLSEVERKMLYFSETGWTLDDMGEVNDAIARQLDQRSYEKLMRMLIRSLRSRLRATDREEYAQWNQAIQVLQESRDARKEDHYLLNLIAEAQPQGEITRLIVTALVVIGVMALALYLAGNGY